MENIFDFLLSHHPNLPCFRDDVIILFNKRLCAGCLIGYPTAVFVCLLIHPYRPESIAFSLLFALLSQIRRFTHNPSMGHFFRFLAGIALGFGMGGFYWAIWHQQWNLILFLGIGAIFYLLSKAYSMKVKIIQYKKSLDGILK